jgi:hypothetical protein
MMRRQYAIWWWCLFNSSKTHIHFFFTFCLYIQFPNVYLCMAWWLGRWYRQDTKPISVGRFAQWFRLYLRTVPSKIYFPSIDGVNDWAICTWRIPSICARHLWYRAMWRRIKTLQRIQHRWTEWFRREAAGEQQARWMTPRLPIVNASLPWLLLLVPLHVKVDVR